MIYLDNNATTAVDPAVRAAMLPYLTEHYGNPSSTYRFGQEARQAVEGARHQVAELIGCEAKEIVFTSGGTESDNSAVQGLLAARAPRSVIIASAVEHSAIREPLAVLAKGGKTVVEIPVDGSGRLDMEMLERVLRERANDVALASIMWANNETGIIFDVAAVGALCRQYRAPLHVDGVQAVGKLAVNLRDLPIDALSVSGHKFHGPKGVGALFVRRGVRWQPWQRGGPQERDRRGGTENVAGIVGMGEAARLAGEALADGKVTERIASMRDRLEQEVLERIPDSHIIGGGAIRVANTTNIGFAGLEAEAILLLLSERDICASAGAACSSGSLEPSHVVRAMGIPDRVAHGAIRFSLSRVTSGEEIDGLLKVLPEIVAHLRKTLPA